VIEIRPIGRREHHAGVEENRHPLLSACPEVAGPPLVA
jgi:hypothetical protein